MNTLYDQLQHCSRHPQQQIVGICSSCLQERLVSLIEPPSPTTQISRGCHGDKPRWDLSISSKPNLSSEPEHALHKGQYTDLHNNIQDAIFGIEPLSNEGTHLKQKTTVRMHPGSSSMMATRAHDQLAQNRGHRHHPSSEFASTASSVKQNGHIDKQDKHRIVSLHASLDKRNGGEETQEWRSRVSFREIEKKGGSWFSMSKSRSSAHATQAPVDHQRSMSIRYPLKSPQHNEAWSQRNYDAYRHVHIPDLQAIADINMKNVSSQNHVSREAGMSSSSIWTFFSRKKSSRSRSNLSNSSSSSIQNVIFDANGNDINTDVPSNRSKSVEAGRLSSDGAPSSLKQLLRKETYGKQTSPTNLSSPLQYMEYTGDNRETLNQAALLQKSKSVTSARSSISVEITKDLMQSAFSPTIYQDRSNVMMGSEYNTFHDDPDLRRSRSWGRTWNRALSPLWGSRSHRNKASINGSSSVDQRDYRHTCTPLTPSHVKLRSATTSACSSRLSPLQRAKLAPTLKNLL